VFSTMNNLQSYIDDVISRKIKIEAVEDRLFKVCKTGVFSGLDEDQPVLDYYTKRRYKMNAHLRSLTVLLERLVQQN